MILGKKAAGPHMVSEQKRDLRPFTEQSQGPQIPPPAFAIPYACTRAGELA